MRCEITASSPRGETGGKSFLWDPPGGIPSRSCSGKVLCPRIWACRAEAFLAPELTQSLPRRGDLYRGSEPRQAQIMGFLNVEKAHALRKPMLRSRQLFQTTRGCPACNTRRGPASKAGRNQAPAPPRRRLTPRPRGANDRQRAHAARKGTQPSVRSSRELAPFYHAHAPPNAPAPPAAERCTGSRTSGRGR